MKNTKEPFIISIGGGKGGVGKSMVSSNIAVQYAQAGLHVTLIDLDIGAANLHTIFGMRQPPKGLGEYLTSPNSELSEYVISTSIPNLQLIPGSGFVPELANLKHAQKLKLISHIKQLNCDIVLLDLGAGTSNSTIDFFTMTQAGIIVTTPEPTAIINAYEFLKNVIYRILFRIFKNQESLLEILRSSTLPNSPLNTISDLIEAIGKKNAWAAQNVKEICADLDFYLIFNQARKVADSQLGVKLHQICQKFLNLDLTIAGMIFFNEEVSASVFKMQPISVVYPDSITSQTLKRIALSVFDQMTEKSLNGTKMTYSAEKQIQMNMKHSHHDFEMNLLTQRRLSRASN